MGDYLHTLSASFNKKIAYTVETITVTAFQPAVQKQAPKHNFNFSEQRPDGRKNMNYNLPWGLPALTSFMSWSLKDKQKLVDMTSRGISTARGAAGHQVNMVLPWDYTVSSRSIFLSWTEVP